MNLKLFHTLVPRFFATEMKYSVVRHLASSAGGGVGSGCCGAACERRPTCRPQPHANTEAINRKLMATCSLHLRRCAVMMPLSYSDLMRSRMPSSPSRCGLMALIVLVLSGSRLVFEFGKLYPLA